MNITRKPKQVLSQAPAQSDCQIVTTLSDDAYKHDATVPVMVFLREKVTGLRKSWARRDNVLGKLPLGWSRQVFPQSPARTRRSGPRRYSESEALVGILRDSGPRKRRWSPVYSAGAVPEKRALFRRGSLSGKNEALPRMTERNIEGGENHSKSNSR